MKNYITTIILALLAHSTTFAMGPAPVETQPATPAPTPAAAAQQKARSSNCYKNICVGDEVMDLYSGWALAAVLENAGNGRFLLRYPDGHEGNEYTPYLAIIAPGTCGDEFCLGDEVIDTYSGFARKTVVGIAADITHQYVLEDISSHRYDAETASYLASTKGNACEQDICVGDAVYDEDTTPHEAQVIGIRKASSNSVSYIMKYSDGHIESDTYGYIRLTARGESAKKYFAERVRLARESAELEKLVRDGAVDRETYQALRNSGLAHEVAIDKATGPAFISLDTTAKFLQKLSEHVYKFDSDYLQQIKALHANDALSVRRDLFIMNALLPMLKNSGYATVKERYLNASAKRIEDISHENGINSLQDIETSALTRKLAAQMLAASLSTSTTQLTDSQKAQARAALNTLSTLLASNMNSTNVYKFNQSSAAIESLLLELSQNTYLQARTTTDMLLLEYLKNS